MSVLHSRLIRPAVLPAVPTRALRILLAAGLAISSLAAQSPANSAAPPPAQTAAAPPPVRTVVRDPRQQQVAAECARLLALAADLKAAVDRSNKDELSVAVVRKAAQVEQLARTMKGEMKPAVGKERGER